MSDFEDYESDEPEEGCSTCGDPLCPGCDPSPQAHLLKLAILLVFIVMIAWYVRGTILGDSDSTGIRKPSASAEPDQGIQPSSSPESSVSTTLLLEEGWGLPNGQLPEQTIRSVVQVVLTDARGPCWSGSGSIVGESGFVLTSFHVIQPDPDCIDPQLEVWTISALDDRPRSTFLATVILANEPADLAILHLAPRSSSTPTLSPIPIGVNTSVGEEIFVVGFPGIGGSSITVSKGIVSGYTRENGISWIKTDASISGGSSGGAAFNSKGELIGIPTRASVGVDGQVVDCRPTLDSNGDGRIDEYDACQPIGGFLNLLSPGSEAEALIKRALSQPPDKEQTPTSEQTPVMKPDEPSNTSGIEARDPRFPTCREAIRNGYGPYIIEIHEEYDWYRDADSDGVVCER